MNDRDIREKLYQNITTVFRQVLDSCQDSTTDPKTVQVVAVTKYVDRKLTEAFAESLQQFLLDSQQHGWRASILGESRPQVVAEKQQNWSSTVQPTWHMIGHLQTNKVKQVVPHCQLIHSIDRFDLAKKIDDFGNTNDTVVRGLVQFNISEEENKGGFKTNQWKEVVERFQGFRNLEILGVMGMGGLAANQTETANQFKRLKDTQLKLNQFQTELKSTHCKWKEVSMGMSGDFALAIKEGSTLVRIGSAFFKGIR